MFYRLFSVLFSIMGGMLSLTHCHEAEFSFFASGVTIQTARQAFIDALSSQALRNERYALHLARDNLFKRPGRVNSIARAYRGGVVDGEEHTIYATRSTKYIGFVDDMAITFSMIDGRVACKVFSVSRVGESDLGMNAKNVHTLTSYVGKTNPHLEMMSIPGIPTTR